MIVVDIVVAIVIVYRECCGNTRPTYLWPLGSTSAHQEVMKKHNALLPSTTKCFATQSGVPDLPYDAITFGYHDFYMDIKFSGEVDFQVRDVYVIIILFVKHVT